MKLRIKVENYTYDVDVEVLQEGPGNGGPVAAPAPRAAPAAPVATAPVAPVFLPPAQEASSAAPSSDRVVKAPLAGTVVSIKVATGDVVEVNKVLVVMEAMKMETNIASPLVGTVKQVLVAVGQAVKAGQVLVEFD